MKTRLISSGIGLILLVVVLALFNTLVVNVAFSIISMLAVLELLKATGCLENKFVCACAVIFSGLMPFLSVELISKNLLAICYSYVILMLAIFLRWHDTVHIQQLAMIIFFSISVPMSFTTFIYMRDRNGMALGIFYTLVSVGSAWLSDSGAYFCGRAFGKHKLAPVISPKKTIEGAIGGMLTAMVTLPLVIWFEASLSAYFGAPLRVNYLLLIAFVPILSVLSVVGDLAASTVKRNFGVKDYGSIMPGHGGVMDRFDSVLLVAPMVLLIAQHWPLAALA